MRHKIIKFTTVTQHVLVVQNTSISFFESKEEREKSIRRASFEKSYKKRQTIVVCTSLELVSFANGVEKAIAEFRNNK